MVIGIVQFGQHQQGICSQLEVIVGQVDINGFNPKAIYQEIVYDPAIFINRIPAKQITFDLYLTIVMSRLSCNDIGIGRVSGIDRSSSATCCDMCDMIGYRTGIVVVVAPKYNLNIVFFLLKKLC